MKVFMRSSMDFQAISGNANANAGNANANANTNAKRNVGVADSFNYIVVDEGQDFTPCQAAVFFHQDNNSDVQ